MGTKKASSKDTEYEKNKAKISSMKLSKSLKHLRFLLFQTQKKKNADWHHFPNRSTPLLKAADHAKKAALKSSRFRA
jgi:hypothetical protein